MTKSEILLDVYRRLNFQDSPPTKVVNRLTTFLNQRHRRILTAPGISQLRDDNITFTTVANTAVYSLPPNVGRILNIYDSSTNQRKLIQRSLAWVRTNDPRSNSGTPEAWIPLSFRQVQRHPSAQTAIYIKSTSASDTNQITVEYTRASGIQVTTTANATGVTAVQVGTATDVIGVDKFFVTSNTAVGSITLETAASGGTVLSTISAGESFTRYVGIQLWPTPSTALTLNVDFTRDVPDLVKNNDEPLLPPDFHYLLPLGIRIDEYEFLDDDRRHPLQREWDQGMKRLLNWVTNTSDLITIPGGGDRQWSSLGPWFPPGS